MTTRNSLVPIAAMMLVLSASPFAHHGMRDYRDDRIETVEGTLVNFDVANPHSIIYLDSRAGQGTARQWRIEWVAGLQLKRQGVTERTLKPGDHLVITGYPSHDPAEHRLKLRTVVRPADGWKWTGTFG